MREIKFRAYAQTDKTWHYWDVYGEYPQGISADLQPDMGNTYVFQQYTGLKDKNGVEIYECDLLSGHKLPVGDLACEVQFLWGCWYLNAISKSGHSLCGGELISMTEPSDTYEVMGNIFEGVDE